VAGLAAGPDAGDEMPAWEGMLIQAGFIGMGLGLAVALPAYFRRRWPVATSGRVGDVRLSRRRSVDFAMAVAVGTRR
jgi:hypothetical protein